MRKHRNTPDKFRTTRDFGRQAKQLSRHGRHDESLALLLGLLSKDPDNVIILNKAARECLLVRDEAGAIELFERSYTIDPKDPITAYMLASLYLNGRQIDKARPIIEQRLEKEPDNAGFWCIKGEYLMQLGRIPDAIEAFNKSCSLDTRYPRPWSKLGYLYLNSDNLEESATSFYRYLDIKPNDPVVINKLGYVLGKLNRNDEAESTLLKGIGRYPDFMELRITLGKHYIYRRLFEKALDVFMEASLINPNHRGVQSQMSYLCDRLEHKEFTLSGSADVHGNGSPYYPARIINHNQQDPR